MQHHFIPRFYLEGFTDPDAPAGPKREPYAWVCDLVSGEWRARSPLNIARKSGYYNWIDDTGRERDDLERTLSRIEDSAARILRSKILAQNRLTPDERSRFALFVTSMGMRLPALHDGLRAMLSSVADRWLKQQAIDPSALREYSEAYERATGRPASTAWVAKQLSQFRIRPKRATVITEAMNKAILGAPIVAQMGWHFLLCRRPDYFVTSDQPFFMVDPGREDALRLATLRMPGMEVTLPLSQDVALLAWWRHEGTRWSLAESQNVAVINQRAIVAAKRFVISPTPTYPLDGSYRVVGSGTVWTPWGIRRTEDAEPLTGE